MTPEEEQAYKWALNQSYPSVAARYARILAAKITAQQAERDALRDQLQAMLNIFDRSLPDGSIGRYACDEARRALDNPSDQSIQHTGEHER